MAKLSAILLVASVHQELSSSTNTSTEVFILFHKVRRFPQIYRARFSLRLGFPQLSQFSSFHTDSTMVISYYELRECALSAVQDFIPSLLTFKLHSNCLIVYGFSSDTEFPLFIVLFPSDQCHCTNAFSCIILYGGQNMLYWESLVSRDTNVSKGSMINGIPTSLRD